MTFREPPSTIVTGEEVSSTLLPVAYDSVEEAGISVAVWGGFWKLLPVFFDCVAEADGQFMAMGEVLPAQLLAWPDCVENTAGCSVLFLEACCVKEVS